MQIKRIPTNIRLVGLVDIFISVLSDRRLELLLIGYDLNIVSSGSKSESHGLPIAYLDLIYIDLDAGVHAAINKFPSFHPLSGRVHIHRNPDSS